MQRQQRVVGIAGRIHAGHGHFTFERDATGLGPLGRRAQTAQTACHPHRPELFVPGVPGDRDDVQKNHDPDGEPDVQAAERHEQRRGFDRDDGQVVQDRLADGQNPADVLDGPQPAQDALLETTGDPGDDEQEAHQQGESDQLDDAAQRPHEHPTDFPDPVEQLLVGGVEARQPEQKQFPEFHGILLQDVLHRCPKNRDDELDSRPFPANSGDLGGLGNLE